MKSEIPSTSETERRKHVKLRVRPDLDIQPQKYEGRTYYVVKDPVSLRYYRFKEQEYFLLSHLRRQAHHGPGARRTSKSVSAPNGSRWRISNSSACSS